MATIKGEWSKQYIREIESLEDELGREICGVQTGTNNTPCKQWPADDETGRCHTHKESSETSLKSQDRSDNPSTTQSSESEDHTGFLFFLPDIVRFRFYYFFSLSCIGIIAGGFSVVAYQNIDTVISARSSSSNQVTASKSINISDPDFTRIRKIYRGGNADRVSDILENIANQNNNRQIRSKALYLQFVLYQNTGDYRKAVKIAEKFLTEFEKHPRRAELLYGIGFLYSKFLDTKQNGQKYFDKLQKEYPQSKWSQKVTSSS